MTKQELRAIYKKKRGALTFEAIEELQQTIYAQVFQFDFSGVKNVHVFLPITKQKEIDTYPIIEFLRKKNKTIIISKSCFKTSTLTHFVFDDNTILQINKYGIPEPVEAKEIHPKEIDLVFVPMLISDKRNYRVGYGKGFYDRFLSDCKEDVKTIGLNFFSSVNVIEDVNSFDVSLDQIVTPTA